MKFLKLSKLFGAGWGEKNRKTRSAKSTPRPKVQLQLEELEDRLAPSVTPVLPEVLTSGATSIGAGYSPQIVASPLDPNKMVEIHSTGTGIGGNYTTDGGLTWTAFPTPGAATDPSSGGAFGVIESPSVAFDSAENVYIVTSQRNSANTSGAIILSKFDFSGTDPVLIDLVPSEDDLAIVPGTIDIIDPDNEAYDHDLGTLVSTSLVAGITSTATTMQVASSAGFPAVPFTVRLGGFGPGSGETVLVTNVDGGTNTWTIDRTFNGTAFDSAWAAGTLVSKIVTTLDAGKVTLYRWANENPGTSPVVAVDVNMVRYTDPEAGTILADSMGTMGLDTTYNVDVPKAVYVAWAMGSTVVVSASADGGNNFSTPEVVGGGTSPQIQFTQGWYATTVDDGTDGELAFDDDELWVASANELPATPFLIQIGDEQIRVTNVNTLFNELTLERGYNGTTATTHLNGTPITVVGGDLMFFWNTGGGVSIRQAKPDLGDAATPVVATQTFTSVVGDDDSESRIGDAGLNPTSGDPDIPNETTYTLDVDITAKNFTPTTLITDVNVTVNMVHANLEQVRVELIPPAGSGVGTITLLDNRLRSDGTTRIYGSGPLVGQPHGVVAADMGVFVISTGSEPEFTTYTAGTVFDDEANTRIANGNTTTAATAPFVGHYSPESFFSASLSNLYGLEAQDMAGTWTLRITDFRDSDQDDVISPPLVQFLDSWSIHFNGIIDNVANPDLAGSLGSTSGVPAAPLTGTEFSVAIDKTPGGYSAYQGRIYVAYTDGANGNDIQLIYSNDNGDTWSNPVRVNDDSITDNYSEGNRPQIIPAVAVDPTTGTLVVTYYDARNDAAGVRYAAAVMASVDGGDHFSPVSFMNDTKTATDFLTNETVDLGPVPGNLPAAGTNGFGTKQGVLVFGGEIFAVFSTNLNSGGAEIYTAKVTTAAGPRIIFGDMGTVTADFDEETNTGTFYYNNTFNSAGVRQLDGFVVQFDRPIEISTFDSTDIIVKYQDPNTGVFANLALDAANPIKALDMPTDTATGFGVHGVGIGLLATTFYIKFATPQSAVGTYSYAIGPAVYDKQRTLTTVDDFGSFDIGDTTLTVKSSAGFPTVPFVIQIGDEQMLVTAIDGTDWTVTRAINGTTQANHADGAIITAFQNAMDQNANSLNNEGITFAASQTTTINMPGFPVGGINDTDVILTVASNANFASITLPFVIQVENEQMLVIERSGFGSVDWTVKRGWNGTEPADHGDGTVINSVNAPDMFSVPTALPTNNVSPITGVPFSGTYDFETLPLIIPGAHVVTTSVPGATVQTTTVIEENGLSDTETSITVADGVNLPTNDFAARIGDENVWVRSVDLTSTTLNGGIISSTTTIVVQSSAAFPSGNFDVMIDSEQIHVVRTGGLTTLTGGISATQTTINVASSSGFSNTPFLIQIGSETLEVTNTIGNTWTVNRGANGTVATTHAASDAVDEIGGNTWTVVRGQNGTTAASHSNNAPVVGAGTMRTLTVTRGFGHTTATSHAAGTTISVGDSFDNLILNSTVSAIDITFDRDINAATFTTADVISMTGPAGNITGPFTVTPINSRTFRIGFPTQTLSGSYSVKIGSQIADTSGFLLDNNLNVGVNVLRGVADPASSTVTLTRPVYAADPLLTIPADGSVSATISVADAFNIVQATTQSQFSDGQTTTIAQVGGISATATTITVASTVGFPSNPATSPFIIRVDNEQMRVTGVSGLTWTVQRGFNGTTAATHNNGATVTLGKTATIQVMLNIGPDGANNLDIRDLTATLTAPDGTVITLFANTGNFGSGSRTSFNNTVFDDTASTPIQLANVPITAGPFNPQTQLSVLDGKNAQGNWTLTITNNGDHSAAGVLNHWEIRLPKATPTNGLGETISDQSTASFRIFTQATTNAQSYTQWTAIGPSGNTLNPDFNGDNAGSVNAIAVDPSDRSGNTVYIGAASGGIWKTTNYLTTDPTGPTWIPLTDLGPTSSLNIGSIVVIGRNSDPANSIIIATTGNGTDTITQAGTPANSTSTTTNAVGVGFLRSMDGGKTWQVLDSLTNVDVGLNVLPMNSTSRDHWFVGSTGNKIIADPTPQANGNIVLYAAISDNATTARNGLYRSLDTGNTWVKISTGNANDRATDVVLAPASAGSTGLLTVLYAAFEGDGVYKIVGNAAQSTTLTKMNGGGIFISRVDLDAPSNGLLQVTTAAPASTPNGAKGDIVLATPALTNNPLADSFYQRWLYAAVATATGSFDGLYITKDGGENWTKINLPEIVSITFDTFGTNNETRTNLDPSTGGLVPQLLGNYTLSLTVDPNDPNVVFLGGTDGGDGTFFRIDVSKIEDPYNLIAYSNDEADGGAVETASDGPTNVKAAGAEYGIVNQFAPGYPGNLDVSSEYFNLYREPTNPFRPATLQFTNVSSFNNRGTGAYWSPLNDALDIAENQHQVVAIKDAITGGTRLYFANDHGTYTGVTNSSGEALENLGSYQIATGSRNGNLQIAQMYDGAAQPSTLAADLADALFYGSMAGSGLNANSGIGYPQSTSDILSTGDLRWQGTAGNGEVNGNVLSTGRVTDGAGVVTDQGGLGQTYNFIYPSTVDSPFVPTDFFQVTAANTATAAYIGGLIQVGDVPGLNQGQWPEFQGSNFAVNPIDSNSAVISSKDGRIFLTTGDFSGGGANITWNVIANPTEIGNTSATNNVSALVFGSRNVLNNEPSDLIYAGTESGRIFVTFTAGGWYEISTGLDGSPIQQIVTNPKPGSYELYAVTTTGVFWMQDASPVYNAQGAVTGVNTQARWIKINDLTGATTTINQTGGITATDTTMTVTSTTNFPTTTPFYVQIGTEIIRVTDAATSTWTIERGVNGTTSAAQANGATITELRHILFDLSKGNFNNSADQIQTLEYLTSLAIDWRYAVPDVSTAPTTTLAADISDTDTTITVPASASTAGFPAASTQATDPRTFVIEIGDEQIQVTNITGTTWTVVRGFNGTTAASHISGDEIVQYGLTHPVLYVAGEGGVFRSRDNGVTWTYYPNVADDGAAQEGGYLPNVNVTALDLALGDVNPTTGFHDQSTGLNMLVATTYGRGQFAIRLDNTEIEEYAVAPVSGPKVISQTNVLASNGQALAGIDITFGSAVDPSTFTTADVVVTGPGGNVSIASVVDISTGNHDVFRINFTTPQTATGNYTIQVGPAVMDFSGYQMNQDGDNLNGEVPADRYFNTFNFQANTPPTISDIGDIILNPGQSTSPAINFTVGDLETSVNLLTVSAQVTTNVGFTGTAPTAVTGGTGASRTVTINSFGGSHGSATVTVTVTDGSGLQTSDTFTVFVNNEPTWNTITSPQTVAHGNTPTNINLNINDANSDSVTATVKISDPLATVANTYGLYSAELTQYFNYYGAQEKFFKSTNGSNPSGGGYYILLPNNKLYAWNGTITTTLAAAPVADFTTLVNDTDADVYKNPALLTSFDPLATLRATYGLTTGGQYFNFYNQNEWFFLSSNGSNSANGGWYVLMPTNKLYAWAGNMTATLAGTPVADFLTAAYGNYNVYSDPLLLMSLGARNETPLVTVENPLYDLKMKYGFNTAAQYFNNRGVNEWYLLSNNGSNPANGGWYMILPNNTLVQWNGSTSNYTLVMDLTPYGNVYANPSLLTGAKLGTAVGITGSVSPNPVTTFPGGTLTLTPTAGFERSASVMVSLTDGLLVNPLMQTFAYTVTNSAPTLDPIANVNIAHNAVNPTNVNTNVTDAGDGSTKVFSVMVAGDNTNAALADLAGRFGFKTANQYTNASGQNETWLKSSNGSNPGNGGWYILTSDNKLYAWNGGSYASTVAGGVTSPYFVADFLTAAYGNTDVRGTPSLLYNAKKVATPTFEVNSGPAYDVRRQFGLNTADQYYNAGGQYEKWFKSSNGSNAANGGWYLLTSNGKLYAYDGGANVLTTIAGTPVADLGSVGVYNNPKLLYQAQPVFIDDGLDRIYQVKQMYGLYTADQYFNYRGANERYFLSGNGSNAGAGGGYYVLMPDNKLYAWNGVSIASMIAGGTASPYFIADFNTAAYGNTNVYGTTSLLYANSGQALGVTATVNGSGVVSLTRDPAFVGSVLVTVTVSDGARTSSQTFKFTVTNNAPVLPAIANQNGTSASGGIAGINLSETDADGDTLTYRATVSSNPLYLLKTQLGLTTADQFFNSAGQNEKWFKSTNGSNSAYGGWYILTTGNKLYAWNGVSYASATAAPEVADFTSSYYGNANVYATTTLLYQATATDLSSIGTSFTAGDLNITWSNTFAGQFLVTVYISDGAGETQQTFLTTVS